jgi:hypothetical protein
VRDVDRTRAFKFNVSRSELDSCTRFTDCFVLNVTNGSDAWKLSLNENSGDVTVAVNNGTGPTTCAPVAEEFVTVDVTAGTVGGVQCEALNFSEAPDTNYDIVFRNGDSIGGTYSFVVDNSAILGGTLPTDYTGNPNPELTPALYDVTVDYTYQRASVNYSSSVRVAPGEPDA